jgi:capsular exopolysaccharide synthesis family protein
MMLKTNEAGIASVIRPSNITLVSPAKAPLRPVRPNIPLNLILGTFLGLVVAVGIVSAQEHGIRPLQAPGDVQAYLSLPELGAIPSAESSTMQRLLGTGPVSGKLELISWEKKLSILSESFRGTVTSILLSSFDKSSRNTAPRTLVVTSSLPGEGKTTVVTNLAITLAGLNQRVVLIDGDLRRPRLHDIFGLTNSRGLSTVIGGSVAIDHVPIEALVQSTKVPNLSVMLSGPGTHDIGSLLYSARMEALIGRLRSEFDYVLIDVPPSLMYSDARLLAHFSDGVVLVVRANQANDRLAQTVIQRFVMDGVPVVGTILNDWNTKNTNRAYYGYGKGVTLGSYDGESNFWSKLKAS